MADYSRQFEKQPPSTSFVAVNQDAGKNYYRCMKYAHVYIELEMSVKKLLPSLQMWCSIQKMCRAIVKQPGKLLQMVCCWVILVPFVLDRDTYIVVHVGCNTVCWFMLHNSTAPWSYFESSA